MACLFQIDVITSVLVLTNCKRVLILLPNSRSAGDGIPFGSGDTMLGELEQLSTGLLHSL